jgi:thioredoxin reductase (NADPH)
MARPVLMTIDDEPSVLRAVQRDLQNHFGERYRVLRADSGQAGLDLLSRVDNRGDEVALFLVDHRMPQMDGIEFLSRARDLAPRARRVLLTAYAETDAAIRAINDIQLDRYLLKPWDPPEEHLYPVLDDLLDCWERDNPPPYEGLRILGTRYSRRSYELRDFLARNLVPYRWVDIEAGELEKPVQRLKSSLGDDWFKEPIALFENGEHLLDVTTGQIAERIRMSGKARLDHYDLLIIGAGPAGLAAAVYGASEGLRTLMVEREAPGGQAGCSSRIENYLGFQNGISGTDLTRNAIVQAKRFDAELLVPHEAVGLRVEPPYKVVTLDTGAELSCDALLIASGVQWRKLDIPGVDRLQGAGVYYGGGLTEASTCKDEDVFIVGGANSAGQAAMHFSRFARRVVMLVRGKSLSASMSQYLIDQIQKTSNITVQFGSQVVEAHGETHLESISVRCEGGGIERVPANALFIFIGAEPRTDWLDEQVARDEKGFILTGSRIPKDQISRGMMDRDPTLLETNVPGVFAVGDVRAGSVKRVASGVGEGSIAVQFIHQYLNRS